jgi:putative membrane protein
MNRRNLVSALGAFATLPLVGRAGLAQPVQMTPDNHQPGDMEDQHMRRTAAVGSLSLLISRLAVNRVQNPKLLQFAKFEVAEQNTISDIIKGMMQRSPASGEVVPPSDQEAMSHLGPKEQEDYQKLQAMSGHAFERAYIEAEVDGHQKLLGIQNDYLATGHNREELDVAKLAKGMIQEHLVLLGDLHRA